MFVIVKISVSQGGGKTTVGMRSKAEERCNVIDPPFPIRYCGFFGRFQCLLHNHFVSLAGTGFPPKNTFQLYIDLFF